jgi:DNA-binding LacI/PurR family transcriptional regulator
MTSPAATKQKKTIGQAPKKYDRVSQAIEEGIDRGTYSGQLPGVTLLAKSFKVNPLTICKALESLQQRGIVSKISRVGTFVNSKKRLGLLSLMAASDCKPKSPPPNSGKFLLPPVFNGVLEGIHEAVDQTRYSLLMHAVAADDHKQLRHLMDEVDGLIVIGNMGLQPSDFDIFHQSRWVKAMGLLDSPPRANHVSYDNDGIGRMAAEYLQERGCERFYYFGGTASNLFASRHEQFTRMLAQNGNEAQLLDLDIAQLTLEVLMERARQRFQEIFKGNSPRTGLFLSSSSYVVPVYQLLYAMGIQPMRDVEIITCENLRQTLAGVMPQPAIIDLRMKEIGRKSVEMLLGSLEQPQATNSYEKVVYTPQLILSE